jgi:hypothetical protein
MLKPPFVGGDIQVAHPNGFPIQEFLKADLIHNHCKAGHFLFKNLAAVFKKGQLDWLIF